MAELLREWFCTLPVPAVPARPDTILILKSYTQSLCYGVLFIGVSRLVLNLSGLSFDILKGSTDLVTCLFFYLTVRNTLKAGLSWLTLLVVWAILSVCLNLLSLMSTILQISSVWERLGGYYGFAFGFSGVLNLVGGVVLQSALCYRSYVILKMALPNWLNVASGLDADQQHYVRLL